MEGDENHISSAAAGTLKLIVTSIYGYQIMDRHTVAKNLSRKKHLVKDSRLFRKLDQVSSSIYEVELVKVQIEH